MFTKSAGNHTRNYGEFSGGKNRKLAYYSLLSGLKNVNAQFVVSTKPRVKDPEK